MFCSFLHAFAREVRKCWFKCSRRLQDRYRFATIECLTCPSTGRSRGMAGRCACIARQICARDCRLLGCCNASDDPIVWGKGGKIYWQVNSIDQCRVSPDNCTGMAGTNSFATKALDLGSIEAPASWWRCTRRSWRWWCQGTGWSLLCGEAEWTRRHGSRDRKVHDSSCNVSRSSLRSSCTRSQIRLGSSKRHPSSNVRRSNPATSPSAPPTRLGSS